MSFTFPHDQEQFVAAATKVLIAQGQALEVDLLVNGLVNISVVDEDDFEGYVEPLWGVKILLPPEVYGSIPARDRAHAEDRLESTFRGMTNELRFKSVQVAVQVAPVAPDWRAQAARWLQGDGVNNQGGVRSDNRPSRSDDGLLFRSKEEVELYRALKSEGLAFAPLPVFLHGGKTYRRIEPDFVVWCGRVLLVVEVDGDSFHRELPAEAAKRLQMLTDEGAVVERVRAADCDTPEKARQCVARLKALLNKHHRMG